MGAIAAGILLAKRISDPIAKTIEIAGAISEGNYMVRFAAKAKTKGPVLLWNFPKNEGRVY